ncbi:MAG: flagellar basal body-associated FliL family protein [Sedimentisphaerales bacterium]|jgi:flagellar basal body-associated protein FliL|nr:flagellar basal body-associated FliL family protein [Sedimentisphaerales bacterium]HNY79319.1 flagellar basal body-associated FliL family protein [Sedimentisphaerales bacterium]HOC64483.1 flagellar basal body-associated FliL family protein [Sedimentisphaerales bacterium]HOH63346.1 flagellar basal body-associated FliL family protein [Sedimentisphaerales bacterium]HPY49953.1 flagellar basal body-associated FliL family protein [Sedimentisphaerales bacterium]
MAEPEKREKKQRGSESGAPDKEGKSSKLMPWLIPAVTVALCAGGGFVVGRLFGTRGQAQNVAAAEAPDETAPALPPVNGAATGSSWYYDLEPVVSNLNEPGVTRYVRITLTLEVGDKLSEKDGTPFLEQRKPLLKNWLTLFVANLTLEDIRGERNLRSVQSQIADTFNQGLFPNAPPCIKRVLFKELSIQ